MSCVEYVLETNTLLRIVGGTIFHFGCYYLLARKLVRWHDFENHHVLRVTFYPGIVTVLCYITFFTAQCGPSYERDFAVPMVLWFLSFYCWSEYVSERRTYSQPALAGFMLGWPVIGPAFALLWILYSYGMPQLYGYASREEAGWRRHFTWIFLVLLPVGVAYVIYLEQTR